jgi:hypothetical protein
LSKVLLKVLQMKIARSQVIEASFPIALSRLPIVAQELLQSLPAYQLAVSNLGNACEAGEHSLLYLVIAERDCRKRGRVKGATPGIGNRSASGYHDPAFGFQQAAGNHRIDVRREKSAYQERQPLAGRAVAALLQQPYAEKRAR